ncbi:MAG: efflux RND transporter periplasmic adaptor subunit [Nitrospinota bacterium]
MTKREATMWDCLCLNRIPYEIEVCPECGRNRDFVIAKRDSRRPTPDGLVSPATRDGFDPSGIDRQEQGGGPGPPRGFPRQRGRRLLRWAVNIAILLALYWGTTSAVTYLRQPKLQMLQSPIAGALAVAVEQVKSGPIASKVTYTGTLSPLREMGVYPRVQGWIQDFSLYEGDAVQRGQVIARLDRAEQQASVSQARERIEAGIQHRAELKARLGVHRANIQQAKAALEEAEANLAFWKKESRRVETLFQKGAISGTEVDNARKELAVAKGKRDTQRARLQSHRAKLQTAKRELQRVGAMLRSRRAELSQRSAVLGYTNILAPISGVVAKRHIYSGVLVKPGTPIVDIADISKVRVQVRVAEQDIPRVSVGTPAVVRLPSMPSPHNVIRTKVSTIFPKLDPVTRTNTVEMIVDNPEGRLKPDMFAVVDLILEEREKTLTVPRAAVTEIEGEPSVFIVDGEEAVAKPVKLGLVSGDRAEILKGVQEGDLVVYKGNRGLVDGQEVSVVSRR